MRKAFVVLNPVAGQCDVDVVRQALEQQFAKTNWTHEVYETTGQERVAEIVHAALGRGFELFVAAGGDGTVSGVAGGIVHTAVPMGIIPVGTTNALARELDIPLEIDGALSLLMDDHAITNMDAMRIGDQFFVLNIGIGISALMMRDTERDIKRRFGRIAYLWTGLGKLLGLRLWRFTVKVDGQSSRLRASEVLVVNGGGLGEPYFHWEPHIRLDDGRLDVFVLRARTAPDYLRVAWELLLGQQKRDPNVRFLSAERSIAINADRPLPVQADGDVIGQTPIQVQVVPNALQVIVPATA
jgi:YegS/Rv2252/BmrU family lipid kinase